MSRKNPSKQSLRSFTNSPFQALKGFSPKPLATKKNPVKNSPASTDSGESDRDLFLRVAGHAKNLTSDARPQKKRALATQEQEDEGLFLQAIKQMGPDIRSLARKTGEEVPKNVSSSNRMKQMRRGTIRIGAELDLHGFQKAEALFRLDHFIKSSYARGLRAVLVITGKGINSPEGPVLQGAVMEWLRKQGRGFVAEFVPAPRDKGGFGAFAVFLKRKK